MDYSYINGYSYTKSDPLPIKCLVLFFKHTKIQWIVQICAVTLHLCILTWGQIEKSQWFFPQMHIVEGSLKTVDFIGFVLLVATNIMCLAYVHKNIDVFEVMFAFQKKLSNKRPGKINIIADRVIPPFLTVLIPTDLVLLLLKVDISELKYLFIFSIEYWSFALNISMMICVFHRLKYILETLNNFAAEQDFKGLVEKDSTNQRFFSEYNFLENMKLIVIIHNDFCDMLDQFNKEFKTLMVMLVLSINATILWNIVMVIKFDMEFTSRNINLPSSFVYSGFTLGAALALVSSVF